jgi:hypothetical protein
VRRHAHDVTPENLFRVALPDLPIGVGIVRLALAE